MRASRWSTVVVRLALLVETVLQAAVLAVLRLRGRHHPVIVPFIGHGSTRRIRIGGRVMLGRSDVVAPAVGVPDAPTPTRRSRRAVLRASLARFVTVEVAGAGVTVHPPAGEPVTVRTDREGYFDAVLDVDDVEPGWHPARLVLDDGTEATAQVVVVDPDARIGLVSDVDDTILETGLTRGLQLLRITLLTAVDERAALPGAAPLYRALLGGPASASDGGPGRAAGPVFYLSTSPWNLHEVLLEFITLRRFPFGPLLLTDWGPSHSGLFRIGAQEHKLGVVRRLLTEHPELALVLIGDSGQADPDIYATLAREHPARIRAVYIRRTAHVDPRRGAAIEALAAEVTAAGVPMLVVEDSVQIAAHAADLGLLDPAAVAEVRAGQ